MSGARRAGVLAAALLGGVVSAAAPAAGDDALHALRWQHRVLLMFAVIDAMPMRRDEIRARGTGCPPGTRG